MTNTQLPPDISELLEINRTLAGLAFDDYAVKNQYTQTQAVLDLQERSELKAVLDPKAEAGPKIALARSILQPGGKKADRLMRAMEADPVFMRAASLIAATGSDTLAAEMLSGQQKVALKTVMMPPAKD